jgi:hypothetical protein
MRAMSRGAHTESQLVARGRDGQDQPLLVVAQQRVGLRRAFKVLSFMVAWEHARAQLRQQELTVPEYAEWWREPESTVYRHQAAFRDAFPGETNPDRLLDRAAQQWDARSGVGGLGRARLTV